MRRSDVQGRPTGVPAEHAHARACHPWPERRFSGTHFRIDAVYQRTIAELRARGSLFWLVFAPLARDATGPELGDGLDRPLEA